MSEFVNWDDVFFPTEWKVIKKTCSKHFQTRDQFLPSRFTQFPPFPAEFQEGAHGLIQGRSQDAGGFVAGVAGQVLETFGGTFSSEIEDWGIHHEI